MGSDLTTVFTLYGFVLFQSTLPHGERRRPLPGETPVRVSIHAPTWGATFDSHKWASISKFQSTLPHGERPPRVEDVNLTTEFQSTLPHGERPLSGRFLMVIFLVSIHAPTWGATSQHLSGCAADIRFNPRSHMGSDSMLLVAKASLRSFNPRSHMGSDSSCILIQDTYILVSIHAPTWGATPPPDKRAMATVVSIHAPTWGATPEHIAIDLAILFQSTLPHGERPNAI